MATHSPAEMKPDAHVWWQQLRTQIVDMGGRILSFAILIFQALEQKTDSVFQRFRITPSRAVLPILFFLIIVWSMRLISNSFSADTESHTIALALHPTVKTDPASIRAFKRAQRFWGVASGTQKKSLHSLLAQFDVVARYHNFTYLLHQSTALGTYRHHSLVPWDHRLIILMEFVSSEKLCDSFFGTQLMLEIRPPDVYHPSAFWVVYLNQYSPENHPKDTNADMIPWPYLEVHRYRIENNELIDTDSPKFRYPVTHILPPVFSPFEQHMLPSYRCLEEVVISLFSVDTCCLPESYMAELMSPRESSLVGNDKPDEDELVTCMACKALEKYFRFVRHRIRISPFLQSEEVRIAEETVSSQTIYRPQCGIPIMGRT